MFCIGFFLKFHVSYEKEMLRDGPDDGDTRRACDVYVSRTNRARRSM